MDELKCLRHELDVANPASPEETDFVAVAINLLEQLEETEPDDEFAETA